MTPEQDSSPSRTYTITEAANVCGFDRRNTFRERFLSTPKGRNSLVVGVSARGALQLHAGRVDELARMLDEERRQRGNWRPRNLGAHARRRIDAYQDDVTE